jgi:protein O-GlcNAc transferase
MTQTPQTVWQALRNAVEHQHAGRLSEAAQIYGAILTQHPNQPDALHLLGVVAVMTAQPEKAVDLIGRAIGVNPSAAGYHNSLGIALAALGREDDAVAAHRKAVELDPHLFNAHHNLGSVLASGGRYDEAISSLKTAVRLKPDDPNTHSGLGVALLLSQRLDEAITEFEEAKRLSPNSAQIFMHLGNAYLECAQHDDAIGCFDRALSLEPKVANRLSSRIFAMHYHPGYDSLAILKSARQWEELVTAGLTQPAPSHMNDRTAERKLRIGYVSPDFRNHPVGRSILPLISDHDRGQFEIYCYSSASREDSTMSKLRESADEWRDICQLDDERVAETIRNDRIDILVDLALHTVGHRLSLFARKPAPVQMSYLGYCSTTGLGAMDYRLSDPFVDPAEVDLSVYSEKTVRLPRNYLCYVPMGDAPAVSALPCLSSGFITFGCLNKFAKCSADCLDLWARILQAVPNSRLVLHAMPGWYLDRVRGRFERGGVSPSRLEFVGKMDWPQYVATYARIDIALDPFPYNGGITTCDALWMGVLVITLSGKTAVGRVGRSILSNVGLPELVAQTPEQYVQLAVDLANNPDRLKELRAELRPRLQESPLMDGRQLARDIASAYRNAWRKYCAD